MKKVFIKYNPYTLKTEITVDGEGLAKNSKLGEKSDDGHRLQEWVEELPHLLYKEYKDIDFEITFHGTLLDYEDLTSVFPDGLTIENRKITADFTHKRAKETSEKEALIDAVFKKIEQGPFDELKNSQIQIAYEHAKSSTFELCVVATMSTGKSTLINAMLGQKLLPSKQEACTAMVTRIKDVPGENKPFRAEAFNRDGKLLASHEFLTLQIMKDLNENSNVARVDITGNIPFMKSDDVSLVLIDTPGPTARDPNHRRVFFDLMNKSSKPLILYISTGEYGQTHDSDLLKRVSENMSVGGKQSKDRFIFVINKLDERKEEDGDLKETLDRIKNYLLYDHKIENPNIFPAAALPALNIRLKEKLGEEAGKEVLKKARHAIEDFTDKYSEVDLHFEKYSKLPKGIAEKINNDLEAAVQAGDSEEEALIHTGVVSIEAAIKQYVEKYAKTAKIKNIVDTFKGKLEELDCEENTKKELAKRVEDSEEIVKQIDLIQKKKNDAEEAKNFKSSVEAAVKKVGADSKIAVEDVYQRFHKRVRTRIDECGGELTVDEAEDEVESLIKFAKRLEPELEADLGAIIENDLLKVSAALLKEYEIKLKSLAKELDLKDLKGFSINPFQLMKGSVERDFSHIVREEERVVGEEKYQSYETTRDWFESWKFWPKKEYVTKTRKIRKNVQYVNSSELAQFFFAPVESALLKNRQNALGHSKTESEKIKNLYSNEFKRLDTVLEEKLKELKRYATEKDKAEERIKESEGRLKWLREITSEVEEILEV